MRAFLGVLVAGCGFPMPAPLVDAGAGGDGAASTYHSMTAPGVWSTFDVSTLDSKAGGFVGGTFDGRYVYFAPYELGATADGLAAQLDTHATFSDASAWALFDTTTLAPAAKGFFGAAFDGTNVYFAPWAGGGQVAQFASASASTFTDPASWHLFDTNGVISPQEGFTGATFDGRYLYLCPQLSGVHSGIVAQLDTKATFTSAGSWSKFDATTVNANARGYLGGVFDGRYVYFVPFHLDGGTLGTIVSRYDTTGAFTDPSAWSVFDTSTVNGLASGFAGAVFDGRYIYMVPTNPSGSYTVRYDTTATFSALGSWESFGTTLVSSHALGFVGGAFDGRYVYYIPNNNGSVDGELIRFDTTASFVATSAWSSFDTATVNPQSVGFEGAVFDGRYLYLVPAPGNSVVTRFDARAPSLMPSLPAFSGSFL